MTFFVNWKQIACDRVAEIWLAAPDRARVTASVNEIDSLLRRSPQTAGEQRDGAIRLVVVDPLAVVFEVNPDDLRVDVLEVRRVN